MSRVWEVVEDGISVPLVDASLKLCRLVDAPDAANARIAELEAENARLREIGKTLEVLESTATPWQLHLAKDRDSYEVRKNEGRFSRWTECDYDGIDDLIDQHHTIEDALIALAKEVAGE